MGMHFSLVWSSASGGAFQDAVVRAIRSDHDTEETQALASLDAFFTIDDRRDRDVTSLAFFTIGNRTFAFGESNIFDSARLSRELSSDGSRVGCVMIETTAGYGEFTVAEAGKIVRRIVSGNDELEVEGEPVLEEPPFDDCFYMDEADALLERLGVGALHGDAILRVGPVTHVRLVHPPRPTQMPPASSSSGTTHPSAARKSAGTSGPSLALWFVVFVAIAGLIAWMRAKP